MEPTAGVSHGASYHRAHGWGQAQGKLPWSPRPPDSSTAVLPYGAIQMQENRMQDVLENACMPVTTNHLANLRRRRPCRLEVAKTECHYGNREGRQ